MNTYNDEYYLIFEPEGEEHIYPEASKNTISRKYGYKKNERPSEPFFFTNEYSEEDKEEGIVRDVTDILLDGTDLIVSDKVLKLLPTLEIDGMQINSAIYIDDDNKWMENYWYLTFYNKLLCLDDKLSEALTGDLSEYGHKSSITINKYRLNEKVLSGIPLSQRLLFKIGGTSFSYVFAHESIVEIISRSNIKGARFFKVSDFEEGDQY